MSEIDLQAIASRRIVYSLPTAIVRREQAYQASDGSMQHLDIYRPAGIEAQLPAVISIVGYPDSGMQRVFGRHAKDLGSTVSWAELMAASGLAVVTYVNVNPIDDAVAVLEHVRKHAPALGIDPRQIGISSYSGNVPNALGLLMGAGRDCIRRAALLYGYMLDADGSTIVKEMSKFGFVTPADGKSVDDLPADTPLFIARAGLDEMPRLNETIDAFVARALARNLPITVANHHAGPHAFDAVHDSEETRRIIRQVVAFLLEGGTGA